MNVLYPREPINAWTHGAGMLLALPATWLLWRRGRGTPNFVRLSLLVYGLSLVFCYMASALYHGLRLPAERLAVFDRLDRIGIFTLIAGSYTPLACGVMRLRWRWATLATAWMITAFATWWLALVGAFSVVLSTVLYLGMGWGVVVCYVEVARFVPRRALLWLVVGGLCYSVGAVLNLLRWPILWPGVFGSHELFHVFVLAGSLAHFWFIYTVVVPSAKRPQRVLISPKSGVFRVAPGTPPMFGEIHDGSR